MKKDRLSSRAFTLIELLVVISIISILASVVLAALSSARDKGQIGAAQQFAATNYHAFGADALVMYNFNDGTVGAAPTGSTFTDSSANGFNASGCTAGVLLSSDTPGGNSNTSGSFPAGSVCTYTFTSGGTQSETTFSGWIKLTAMQAGQTAYLIALNDTTASNTGGFIAVNSSKLVICRSGNSFSGISSTGTTVIQLNKWYHIACSWDSSRVMTIYVNGKKEGTQSTAGNNLTWVTTSVPVDTIKLWNDPNTGLLDDVAIFNHALAAAEIQHIFAEGATKHALAER